MTAWTEGYVADIPYALGFYRETVPAHIAFSALCVGKHPGLAMAPKRVLELGFGMGLGFIINAAANPDTHFEGVDFNPQHVAHARGLADEAQLTNVSLREASFQDLAREADEGQQDIDLIVLHGILTWVSADAHKAIVDIARKRLKSGGFLYVSYNCMPGWAPVVPLQRLMRENAKRIVGRADRQTGEGLDLARALQVEGALFFSANPNIAARLDKLQGMDRSYLAHEYLNANWFIFHFADVAAMFAEAKASFVGSATLAENMDGVSIPEKVRARVSSEQDPIFRETLRDFVSNKQFRRDLFARGVSDLTPPESNELVRSMRFALCVPRSKVNFKISTGMGELEVKPELYGAVADLLADRSAKFEEIAALPAFSNGESNPLQVLALLVHGGQVLPLPSRKFDPAPAQRLNRVLIQKARLNRFYTFLAAPVAGSGIPAGHIELFTLACLFDGQRSDVPSITTAVLATMRRLGSSPLKDGVAVTDPAEQQSIISRDVETILAEKLPLWQRLGAV